MQTQAIKIQATGTYGEASEEESKRLPAEWKNEPHTVVHYPMGWQWSGPQVQPDGSVVPGRGFVPDLNTITHKKACNGVEAVRNRDGKVVGTDVSKAWAGSMNKGGMLINPKDPRLGPWKGFLRTAECEGGKRYIFVGEEFTRLPGGRVLHRDAGGAYLDFLVYLRDHGLCHPLIDAKAEQLIEDKQKLIAELLKQAKGQQWILDNAKAHQEELKLMRAEWDRLRKVGHDQAEASGDAVKIATEEADVPMPVQTAPKSVTIGGA